MTIADVLSPVVVGIDAGHLAVSEAERWIHDLVAALGRRTVTFACTHLVGRPHPHVATSLLVEAGAVRELTLVTAGVDHEGPGAVLAARSAAARSAGRAVVFAGVEGLTGLVTVADLLASSAIDQVSVLGGSEPADGQIIDTRDFVRPVWRSGRLTLVTQPAAGGRLVPFECPSPTPCCAEH